MGVSDAGQQALPRNHWPTMVDAALRAEARKALDDIAAALPVPDAGDADPTLASGAAGQALFNVYLARCASSEGQRADATERISAYLQAAIDEFAQLEGYPYLYGGFSGIAWVASHAHALGLLDEAEELCAEMDAVLVEWLTRHSGSMLCELVRGLAGLGVYGIERWPRPAGREIVLRVVEALAASTVEHHGRRTWFHAPERLSDVSRRTMPLGCFNLGLSHGVPGTLAFLVQAASLGVEQAAPLADDATAWLLALQRDYANGSCFTDSFLDEPAKTGAGTRLAWCYGDLGVAAALLLAARHRRRPDWERAALDVAVRAAARRDHDSTWVVDAGLCHGAFGNAHIFNRFHAATGAACFREAAEFWVRRGLDMRQPGAGIAGFRAWDPGWPELQIEGGWRSAPGWLEGVAGIGLALMGFLCPVEPAWDRLLLVNIPPGPG